MRGRIALLTALGAGLLLACRSLALAPDGLPTGTVVLEAYVPPAQETEAPGAAATATDPAGMGPGVGLPAERDTDQPYSTSDQPDDVDGYQVHFVYALPSDGADAFLDIGGEIELSATAMNTWLHSKTGQRLRYDTQDGRLDITFLRLPYTAEDISQEYRSINSLLEHWLKITGRAKENKLYIVYYDGFVVTNEGYCGLAPVPPAGIGQTAVLLLRGYNPTRDLTCPRSFTRSADYTGFFEVTILHELLHMLGVVGECAPNYNGSHVSDHPQDLMYHQYDGTYSPLFMYLDYGNDDYY
ncbi:MAG: hypothetical protein KJZ53_08415, partial [Anaerolineales bacterium]|nr:hypothetical protein [Anaerolineales bacterium]